jgi:hypothetical protein
MRSDAEGPKAHPLSYTSKPPRPSGARSNSKLWGWGGRPKRSDQSYDRRCPTTAGRRQPSDARTEQARGARSPKRPDPRQTALHARQPTDHRLAGVVPGEQQHCQQHRGQEHQSRCHTTGNRHQCHQCQEQNATQSTSTANVTTHARQHTPVSRGSPHRSSPHHPMTGSPSVGGNSVWRCSWLR